MIFLGCPIFGYIRSRSQYKASQKRLCPTTQQPNFSPPLQITLTNHSHRLFSATKAFFLLASYFSYSFGAIVLWYGDMQLFVENAQLTLLHFKRPLDLSNWTIHTTQLLNDEHIAKPAVRHARLHGCRRRGELATDAPSGISGMSSPILYTAIILNICLCSTPLLHGGPRPLVARSRSSTPCLHTSRRRMPWRSTRFVTIL